MFNLLFGNRKVIKHREFNNYKLDLIEKNKKFYLIKANKNTNKINNKEKIIEEKEFLNKQEALIHFDSEYCPDENNNENITLLINNIKNSGFSTIEYWFIIFTDEAVYFCNKASNQGYGIFGAIEDALISANKIKEKENLKTILLKAQKYYRIEKQKISLIETKKGFVNNSIFINVNNKIIKIKINSKKFKKFLNQLENFKK